MKSVDKKDLEIQSSRKWKLKTSGFSKQGAKKISIYHVDVGVLI